MKNSHLTKKVNNSHRLKTKSIWDNPSKIYYDFLRTIEELKLTKTICILGCSDGKFVLPAAKRGFKVLAIDIDKIALYGGTTIVGDNKYVTMGLIKRTKIEKLMSFIEIVEENFMLYSPRQTFSGVFTSGSIHYEFNFEYKLEDMINKIKNYVSPGGLLLIEYIHKSDSNNNPKKHFVTAKQIAFFFKEPEWTVTSNKKKDYIEEPNPRMASAHKIVWGRLYAKRNK